MLCEPAPGGQESVEPRAAVGWLPALPRVVPDGWSANLTLGITSRLPVNWELAEQWILTSLLPNTNCQLDPRTRSFLIADDSFLIAGMRVTEFLPALFPS